MFVDCRPRFARLAASPLPRACIALTKSKKKRDCSQSSPEGVRLIEVSVYLDTTVLCLTLHPKVFRVSDVQLLFSAAFLIHCNPVNTHTKRTRHTGTLRGDGIVSILSER